MKITYTGRQVELAPAQLKKIDAQFAKVGKLLDGREESEAHVVLSLERHLHQAEITVNYHNHELVSIGSNVDLITAIHSAIGKLEKQSIKVRAKWRDTQRTPRKEAAAAPAEPAAQPGEAENERRVFRINHHERRKPMTLEEHGEQDRSGQKTPRLGPARGTGDHHRAQRLGKRFRPQGAGRPRLLFRG
jgi:putative sigma-54 modulation protein